MIISNCFRSVEATNRFPSASLRRKKICKGGRMARRRGSSDWSRYLLPERPMRQKKLAEPPGEVIHAPEWGILIAGQSESEMPAIWFLLRDVPIIGAWQLPRTCRELSDRLAQEQIDLAQTLAILGNSMRKRNISGPVVMMLGFPVPTHFGEAPSRVHWLAICDVRLTRKNSARQGFRPTEGNRQRFDRELARFGKALVGANMKIGRPTRQEPACAPHRPPSRRFC